MNCESILGCWLGASDDWRAQARSRTWLWWLLMMGLALVTNHPSIERHPVATFCNKVLGSTWNSKCYPISASPLFTQIKSHQKSKLILILCRWQNIHVSGGVLCVLIITYLAEKKTRKSPNPHCIGKFGHLICFQNGISSKSKQSSHKEHGRSFLQVRNPVKIKIWFLCKLSRKTGLESRSILICLKI